MTPLHEAARNYITQHRLLVIPLEEREKKPAFRSGPNHETLATLIPERIDDWWTYRDFNIGLPCSPNRLAVIDVDGGAGYRHLGELEDEYGQLPPTWCQTSNRGDRPSMQFVFRWPSGEMVPTGRISKELEVRAHGAQIVVAPSIHPSGSTYEWITPPSDEHPVPTELPRWVLDLLTLPPPPETPPISEVSDEPAGLRPGDDYNSRPDAIAQTLTLLQAHGWKRAYTRSDVHYLVRPDKDTRDGISASLGHPNTGHGFYVFSTASDFQTGRRYSPFAVYTHLEHKGDWKAAAHSLQARGYGEEPAENPVILPTERAVIPITVEGDAEPSIPASEGFPIQTWRASDILHLAEEPIEWLVKRICVDGTYGLVGGQQKSLKTELMIALDLAVLTGTPFLGDDRFPTSEPSPVLLYLSEGGMAPYMRRLTRWARALEIPLPKHLDDYAIGFAGSKMSRRFLEELHKRIDTTGARLVRLDALYGFSGGDVEGGSIFAMGDLLTGFSNIMTATGTTGYITHHFNETGRGSELTRFAMAGSAGWVDSWIMILHRQPPDPDRGIFKLGLRVGSRQWGENAWEVDVDLGQFDPDIGTHKGLPKVNVEAAEWADVGKWGKSNGGDNEGDPIDRAVANALRESYWLTLDQVREVVKKRKADVLEVLSAGVESRHFQVRREGKKVLYATFDALPRPGMEKLEETT